MPAGATGALGLPAVVDRAAFRAGLERLRAPMGRAEDGQRMSWPRRHGEYHNQ